jgi:hypothetical protein
VPARGTGVSGERLTRSPLLGGPLKVVRRVGAVTGKLAGWLVTGCDADTEARPTVRRPDPRTRSVLGLVEARHTPAPAVPSAVEGTESRS